MFNGLKIKTNSINLLSLVGGATIAAATLALTAGSASAGTLTFSFNDSGVFNGTSPSTNGSTGNYLTAIFTDINPNEIKLELKSSLTNSAHYIDELDFNYKGTLANLSITQVGGSSSSGSTSPFVTGIAKTTANAQGLTGAGSFGDGFDIEIGWTSANNVGRFNANDTNIFTITSTSGVTVEDFNTLSTSSKFMGIHVKGINSNDSGAVASGTPTSAVPEPLTILGAATAGGFGASFKRRLAKAKGNQKAD